MNCMAVTAVILVVAALGADAARFQAVSRSYGGSYEEWLGSNGKAYGSADEKARREQIFKENADFVAQFNSQKNGTFKLSINRFADQTHEEFNKARNGGLKLANLARSEATSSSQTAGLFDQSLASVPASVDWRKEGAVTDVKNQGESCGSCWAFATVATVEGLMKLKTGTLPLLSEQQLIDCVKGSNSTRGCHGGTTDDAFNYIIKNGGITAEANYPYKAADGSCNPSRASQRVAKISSFVNVPENNEAALLSAVAQQPVSAFVDTAAKEFMFYSGGIFNGNCGTTPDHVVTIVGYGEENGVKYWLTKNSWGTEWGEKGYMRLQRDAGPAQGRCGVAMYASYPKA